MIKLDVEPYCCDCCEFDPDVTKAFNRFDAIDGKVVRTDTIVSCSHAKRCETIKRYLERQSNSAKG